MKILQINNYVRLGGGMDSAVDDIRLLLERKGVEVRLLGWNSKNIGPGYLDRARAFAAGIYSFSAADRVRRFTEEERPDVALVHNLYPLISPSVLACLYNARIPTVMVCHNYRLTCPTYLHLRNGDVCDKCQGGREYWCALNNCRGSIFESTAFALHSYTARKLGFFKEKVTLFISWSHAFKRRLVGEGFQQDRIVVIPRLIKMPPSTSDPATGEYVAYSGRLSSEKGLETLLSAATQLPNIPFLVAGNGPMMPHLKETKPQNIHLLGWLDRDRLISFYRNARLLIVPSLWFETFGAVAGEAMSHGLPVIASRRGALQEVVVDGSTGYLFEPGNAADLADKIRRLWDSPEFCQAMGQAGRVRAETEFSEDVFYGRLTAALKQAIRRKSGVQQ